MTQLDQVSRAIASYGGDIDAAVRRLASGRLERLAIRVRPRHGWDDLVLPPERTALLRSIADRYRNSEIVYGEWGFAPAPSRGLVALFSGPSGTGKTLATEVVAGELGLDVFKVNLSTVVSKYIGETEKNLEEMFDAASAGNLLLFFDEADSLVGKRSEVRDARDRYANIEVSYLLQRLENYDGLVIMATNFEKNIDDAFLRRIHVRVAFTIPAEAERLALWRHNLPDGAPTADLDLKWLSSTFEVAGGAIRNATVHAAFLAAAQGLAIQMEHLVIGVAGELRKLGRIVNPTEFGEFAEFVKAI
jgi:SpoVK/Ycf46/Vps4 family AAA+-type ATPase